jgi:hypothetical protein
MDATTSEFFALTAAGGLEAVQARIEDLEALRDACGSDMPALAARIDKLWDLFEAELA